MSSAIAAETYKGPDGAEYAKVEFTGRNESGFIPIGAEVIVLTDEVQAKTASGIIKPDTYTERMNLSSDSGVIVALGSAAFAGFPEDERPKPGRRVLFERFAGRLLVSPRDGKSYRVMTFSCIGALEDVVETAKPEKKG